MRALLAQGQSVAALRLRDDSAQALLDVADRIDWRVGDLLDHASLDAAMQGISHVYHVAGLALPYERERARMMQINVQGTDNLLAAAMRAGVRRVVYVSSIAAVGYPDGVADESMVYNGDRIAFSYMHSKHAAEAVVRRHVQRGLAVVSVCPAAVIAPYCDREHGWGRVFLDVLHRRMPIEPPGGIAVLGSADLVQGLQAAMTKGQPGERYIIASQNVSYRELLATIAAAVAVRPPRLRISRSVMRSLVRLLGAVRPLQERIAPHARISAGVLDLMWRNKFYSTAKAEQQLGFRGCQSLRDCVDETWAWLKSATRSGHT